ncbi:related to Separin [Sporisorium reilianum SRZ2]|uniref:separase n=1 Tax=Sporisorium reilianum (strain SRZ2) TaxID=999809 RepID=E7A2F4_SPORE|nr:related to Separin [Sporisorium reilianum SRZ2]
MPGRVAAAPAAVGTAKTVTRTRSAAAATATATRNTVSSSSAAKTAPSKTATTPATTSRAAAVRSTTRQTAATSSASSSRSTSSSAPSTSAARSTTTAASTASARSSAVTNRSTTTARPTTTSAATASPSAAKLARSRTTAAPATKPSTATIDEAWTEAEVLQALAAPTTVPIAIPHFVLLQFGTTAQTLQLDAELDTSFTFASPPTSLAPARRVYFAKQLVNAGLSLLAQLAASSWSATSSQAPHVLAAVNTYRIAARFLLLPRDQASSATAAGKQKELEVETVILRTCSKLRAIGLTDAARADCEYLARAVAATDTAPNSMLLPPFHVPGDSTSSEPSPARIAFLVELQSSTATHALEAADASALDSIVIDLNHEHGPLAWQLYGRRNGGEVRVLDRAAFSIERAISKALQRLEAPNSQEHLPLRTLALQLLVQVSDIDLAAFWERVARAGGAVLKTAQKDGEDLTSAYDAVQDTFETVIATANNLAEHSQAKSKLQGEGYQRFCEYWISFARKAGSAVGVERATAAMSATGPSPQPASVGSPLAIDDEDATNADSTTSAEPETRLNDKDIAKVCALLTASVVALDKVLAGTSQPDTQAKLDDAAIILEKQVAAWPRNSAMSSQLKLYRVVDQLHRRSCTKLSNHGCDSKGQPKPDSTGTADVDRLSRACLQLLRSLFQHAENDASAETPAPAAAAAKSTPSRTATLPSRDACLTDIVYGYRVLANKLFNATSRSARDDALRELKSCYKLMLSDVAQSIPPKVRSEQLRLLSTSFYNPAGILYNAASYVEAAIFLQLAVDSDEESMELLQPNDDQPSATEQQGLDDALRKRYDAFNKKLEYTAVAYRFAGNKAEALQTYRRLLFSQASAMAKTLDGHASNSSIDEVFKSSDLKGVSNSIKAAVDLSVHELGLDMDPHDRERSLVNWLTQDTRIEPSIQGAILEHALSLLEARSHLLNVAKAMSSIHHALLDIYAPSDFPLRRARSLARRLDMDVLSHALTLSEQDVAQLEEDALACVDAPSLAKDEGLRCFQAQYRCSVLLSTALHARLRQPFEDPQAVSAKVETACKGLSSALAASPKAAQPATPLSSRKSPKSAVATPTVTPGARGVPRKATAPPGRTATTRKALAPRSAPSQPTATPARDPSTPPSKSKPDFDLTAPAQTRTAPQTKTVAGTRGLDRPDHFCQSLLSFHEAFSALALTRCSVQILKAVRTATRLGGEIAPGLEEIFCRASIDLAKTYLSLGKVTRAETALRSATAVLSRTASPSSPSSKVLLVSQDVRFQCLMVQTQVLAQQGDLVGAQARFAEGLKLAPSKTDKPVSSSLERLRQRERQAIAFTVCAQVQMARGDLAAGIESTTLALRQLIRLSGNLSHIASKTQESQQEQSPKIQSDEVAPSSDIVMDTPEDQHKKQGQQQQQQEQPLPKFSSATFSSLFWRSCGLLLDNYMRLSRLHSVRGSAADAEAIAGEGIDFATSLRFALPLAQALIQRGELRLLLNRAEQGQEDLSRCLDVLQNTWIPQVVSLSYVQGDCLMRIEQLGEALRSYTAGEATLRSLSSAFVDAEHALSSPRAPTHHRRKSSLSSPAAQMRARLSSGGLGMDLVLPDLQSRLLQRQAWILHLMGEAERSEEAMEKVASIRNGLATVDARVDQFVLQGRIALRRALEHLKDDHFFSMLPEAALSIPMVPSVSVRTLVAATGSHHRTISEDTVKTALEMLTPADSAFREALSLGLMSSHSLTLREAFASLAQVYTTQAALGKNVKMAANAAAALLDWASSVGVRRNLLMAISSKLRGPNAALEDQEWPSLASVDSQENALASRTQRGRGVEEEDESDEEEALPSRLAKLSLNKPARVSQDRCAATSNPLSAFWQSVRLRHQQAQHEPGSAKHLLPRNWTVISISVRSTDVENLVLTRQEGGAGLDGCTAKEAVLYSLPMNRRSQRDGTEEEEEQLTLKAAQEKLVEIVRLSNDGIHGVKDVQSMDARRQWWSERHRLDDELRDLLQAIQDTWLGGFKGVFSEPTSDARAITALRARFEKIVRRACFPTANKRPAKVKLDDAVFECFAGLPSDCTDEDLEDLVHYVMDALQFSGFQVAVDEIDLDETAMDLRGALEEFHGKKAQSSPNKTTMAYVAVDEEEQMQDHHIFLVLDKDTAMFPWESMPILRNRAVSRIPSMAFLQDRIEMAKIFCRKLDRCQDDDDDDEMGAPELSPLQKGKQAARSRSRSPTKASRSAAAPTLGSSRNAKPVEDHAMAGASDSAWQVALRNGKLFSLSKRKTFYLLNPGGDLVQSQDRFEPWLQGRSTSHGWKGIVGRQPIVDELPDALSSSDLVLYFGHGGAEQFIRQSKVRELQRCAVAMLWGCSSAMLHDNGEFDGTGTPLNYMCAGAPAMVGNLWDMTDRELDSVCEGVFGRLGLMEAQERAEVKAAARNIKLDRNGNLEASRASTEMSLARAVAESRNDCRLPYLTGAATVVYGVPVYWHDL